MSRARIITPVLALLALAACEKTEKTTTTTAATQQAPATSAAPPPKPEATMAPTMATAAPTAALKPVVTWRDCGFSTPESVLYDDTADRYLVSNVEGKPDAVDGKGFISTLTPDGKVLMLKWIEGGKNKVTLNAPKGMTFMGDRLYVADVDTVRMFDRKSGAPMGDVKIAGAKFLNDIATTMDGHVIVSDSGAGSEAIYSIDKDKKVTTLAKSAELGRPNGLLVSADKTWVVTQGTGELYSVDMKGKKGDVQKLPKGSLDGIIALPNGELLVSSWEAQAIYRGKPGGPFTIVVEGVRAPADIGWDAKRSRLLVPLFETNEIRAYEVK